MRKLISIIISIILIVTIFTGCGSNNSSEDTLKVGIDLKYPPFMYVDKNGKPAGLEVDLAYAFGKHIGKKIEIVNTDFSMLIPSLETGETDIVISDMCVNKERKQKVDFTNGYRYSKTIALVNKDYYKANNISDKMTPNDFFNLKDIKIIGLSGTIATSVPISYGKQVTEATEIATAITEVTNGNYNVMLGTNTTIGDHAANPDTTELYFGIKEYSTSAFAVKKGNTKLLNQANEFIKTLYKEDGLYEQLKSKYDTAIGKFLKDDSLGLEFIVKKPE